MAWRIPSARCPRCGTEVLAAEMEAMPVEWALADEDAATLWPHGQADVPMGMRLCPHCRDEIQGLYEDEKRWEREAQAYDGV